jgi:hypothetical protein
MIAPPLINGKAYEYTSMNLIILGIPIAECKSISWNQKQARKMNKGLPRFATSYGNGSIDVDVKLSLSMNEIQTIREAIPSGLLQDIPPFTITLWYGDDVLATKTQKIFNCLFLDDGVTGTTDDTILYMDYNLIASNVLTTA